ncbi:hypothetical protein BB561_005901 [Smittium simulii]|uniref:UBA domain-containing protein n=1 Tax=Smittium simulii TaxID=133385 RepID=A0A2T9Y7Q1_9FUNG|nr:hypothetical protein BB561_005901 [Smittium simulii]
MNYPNLQGIKLKFKLPFNFPDTISLPLEFISETKSPKYDFELENRIINEEKAYKQEEEMQKMVLAQQQMFVMQYLSKKKHNKASKINSDITPYSYLSSGKTEFRPSSKSQQTDPNISSSYSNSYNTSDPNINSQSAQYSNQIYPGSTTKNEATQLQFQNLPTNSHSISDAYQSPNIITAQNLDYSTSNYTKIAPQISNNDNSHYHYQEPSYTPDVAYGSFVNSQTQNSSNKNYNVNLLSNQNTKPISSLLNNQQLQYPEATSALNSSNEGLNGINSKLKQGQDSKLKMQSTSNNQNQNSKFTNSQHKSELISPPDRPIPMLPPKPPEFEYSSKPSTPASFKAPNSPVTEHIKPLNNGKKIIFEEPTPVLPPKPFEITCHDYISDQQVSEFYKTKIYDSNNHSHPLAQKINSASNAIELDDSNFSPTKLYQKYNQSQNQKLNRIDNFNQTPILPNKPRPTQGLSNKDSSGQESALKSENQKLQSFESSSQKNNNRSNINSDNDEIMVEQVYELVSMGFNKKEAIFALEKHSYNVEKATNYLLDNL